MKEYLKRELNKTYLIFSSEDTEYEETYEIEMIIKNEPAAILPLRVSRINGVIELYYDVSARQTLKGCAERIKLSYEVVKTLFEAIDELMKEVKNYLLDMECVLLSLEYIYTKEGKYYFCYCPWKKQEVLTSFRRMMEEILGEIDYHDSKGVELTYHLYQSTCKGDFCIEEILNEHVEKKEQPASHVSEAYIKKYPERESGSEDDFQEPVLEKKEKDEKPGILKRILSFFLKKDEPEPVSEEFPHEEIYQHFFAEQSTGNGYTQLLEPSDTNTVLLENMPAGYWKLRPLIPGYEEFCISGNSFLVGKKRDSVDGFIGRDTISRIHSRLFIRQDRLFVADANSTNGTFVNGIQIQPGEDVEIFPGDRILFADVGYECYNSL